MSRLLQLRYRDQQTCPSRYFAGSEQDSAPSEYPGCAALCAIVYMAATLRQSDAHSTRAAKAWLSGCATIRNTHGVLVVLVEYVCS